MKKSITQRSITSTIWNMGGSFSYLFIGALKSIILMRLLPVDTFGLYATAISIISLTMGIPKFGMNSAFLFRCEETSNVDKTAKNHFTLILIFFTAWLVILISCLFIFTNQTQLEFRTAFAVIALSIYVLELTNTPSSILTREINQKRIAMIQFIDICIGLIVGIFLATQKLYLWALLSTNIVTALVNIYFFYFWKPVWKPQLGLDKKISKYFINFGSKSVVAKIIYDGLARIDDLFTAKYLGNTLMGYYTKAYQLATYPALVLAKPIEPVATSIYAELKHDNKKLSESYLLINSLLIRSGFFLAGLIALVSKEFIIIVLTDKWLPILDAFRFMLIFTLFNPMINTIGNLFVAVGKPEIIVKVRVYQLLTLIIALLALGFKYGISGVAIAVDIMLATGLIIFLYIAKSYVKLNIKKMFLNPMIAISASMITGLLPSILGITITENYYLLAIIKGSIFSIVYFLILLIIDKQQLIPIYTIIKTYFFDKLKTRNLS